MKKKTIFSILAALSAFALTAQASWDVDTIKQVGASSGGWGYLWPTDGSWDNNNGSAGPNCSNRSVARIDLSTAGGAEIYRTALAAHLAGRRVRVWFDSCYDGMAPLVNRVDALP